MCFRHTYLFECKLKVHIRNPSVTPTQHTWTWMLRTVIFLMADLSELVLVLWVQRWGYLETESCSWYLSLFKLCSVERWAYRWCGVSSCCHWHQQTSIISRLVSPAGLRLRLDYRTPHTHPLLSVAMCPPSCSFFHAEEISSMFNMSTRLMKGGGHRARAKAPYSEAWLRWRLYSRWVWC